MDAEHRDEPGPAPVVDRARDDVEDGRPGHDQQRERRDDEDADGRRVRNHAFSSQTSRRPSSVRNGSTRSIVSECGATRSARPPVAIARASTPSSPRMRADDPVDLAREAVDEPGLEPADGRLPDHRSAAPRSRPSRAARRARRARPSRSRSPARGRRRRTRPPARRRRSSSRCRSRRRSRARRSAPSPRPRSRSGRGRPRAGRRSGSGSRSSRPGRRRAAARAPTWPRGASHSRTSTGTVDARQMPSTLSKSRSPPSRTPSSSAVLERSVASRQWSTSCAAVVEPERGLRVADVDGEQHRASESDGRISGSDAAAKRPSSGSPATGI